MIIVQALEGQLRLLLQMFSAEIHCSRKAPGLDKFRSRITSVIFRLTRIEVRKDSDIIILKREYALMHER